MNFKPYAVIFLSAGLMLSPAALRGAQRGGHHSGRPAFTPPPPPPPSGSMQRSNEGGKTRGLERAEESQEMNTRADKNRGFSVAPGVEKAEQHANSSESRRHHGRHHSKKAKKHKKHDRDRDKDGDHDRDDK